MAPLPGRALTLPLPQATASRNMADAVIPQTGPLPGRALTLPLPQGTASRNMADAVIRQRGIPPGRAKTSHSPRRDQFGERDLGVDPSGDLREDLRSLSRPRRVVIT